METIKGNEESNLSDFSWRLEKSGEEQMGAALNNLGKRLGRFMWPH